MHVHSTHTFRPTSFVTTGVSMCIDEHTNMHCTYTSTMLVKVLHHWPNHASSSRDLGRDVEATKADSRLNFGTNGFTQHHVAQAPQNQSPPIKSSSFQPWVPKPCPHVGPAMARRMKVLRPCLSRLRALAHKALHKCNTDYRHIIHSSLYHF